MACDECTSIMTSGKVKLSTQEKLTIYSLYKQATDGDFEES